jgi:hypothetical protein
MVAVRFSTLLIVGALLLSGCAESRTFIAPCDNILGYATASNDGTLTIYEDPAVFPLKPPPLTVRQGTDAYNWYVQRIGGIRPGERKPIIRYIALVRMNPDRSLNISWLGDSGGGMDTWPYSQLVRPGEPNYTKVLNEVGGLEPGQSNGIPHKLPAEGCAR